MIIAHRSNNKNEPINVGFSTNLQCDVLALSITKNLDHVRIKGSLYNQIWTKGFQMELYKMFQSSKSFKF